MMAVDVQTQSTSGVGFSSGKPHLLFEGAYSAGAAQVFHYWSERLFGTKSSFPLAKCFRNRKKKNSRKGNMPPPSKVHLNSSRPS